MEEFFSCLRPKDNKKAGFTSSLIKAMKRRCFCTCKEEKQEQLLHSPESQGGPTTLQEWLLVSSSPAYVVNTCCYDEDYDTEESISILMEKLLNYDNGSIEEDHKSSGEKPKKRVTFKLPEESDIIIFNSPNSK